MDPFAKWNYKRIWEQKALLLSLAVGLVITAALVFSFGINRFRIKLFLLGTREITIEQGTDYAEDGADALFFGSILLKEGREVPVTIQGEVDTKTVGTYALTYRAAYREWRDEAVRIVHVVDTTAPHILLNHNPGTYSTPGGEYFEEGFAAWDSCDGDLTDRVVRTQLGNTITYYVEDLSGNSAQATREIVYYDPVPPELTLKGDGKITFTAGGSYTEPGYTAWDNLDGDLTSKVVVSGSVNPDKAGTYVLTYTVTDSYGHTDTAERTVQVKAKSKPKPVTVKPQSGTVTPDGKVVYLTFDDGPGKYTRRLLEVLAKYNVKATFFLVDTGYINVAKEIVAQGHSVGIHSVSHSYKTIYASEEAFFDDLYAMQSIIENKTGVKTYLMRFPGGSSNRVSAFNPGIMSRLVGAVTEKGFRYFDWNVSSGDAGGTTKTDKVVENVINGIQNRKTSIVLQHDIKGFSVDAVEQIIVWGLENGYKFLPLSMSSPTAQHSVNN